MDTTPPAPRAMVRCKANGRGGLVKLVRQQAPGVAAVLVETVPGGHGEWYWWPAELELAIPVPRRRA